MIKRTIEFTKHENFDDVVANDQPNGRGLHETIGWFVSWAIHSDKYCHLNLFGESNGDLHAFYKNAAGEVTYSMLGQRDEDGSYSTHS